MVYGAYTEAKRNINGKSQPVVAQISVHVHKGPSGEDQGLS